MEPTRIGGQGHADADAEQPPEGRVGTVPFWGEAAASINLVEVVQLIAPGSLSAPGCGGGLRFSKEPQPAELSVGRASRHFLTSPADPMRQSKVSS